MVKKISENKWIVLLFLVSVIVYGIIVSFFTSTVHINVDEELYIALARSFHYSGRFEYGSQLMDYNCVLYSMIISIAYFFYTPQNILFIMRMIGVIFMSSSVFPIYFLAKDILQDSKKAVLLSGFLMIMPYMFDCAYIMQEVLSYPLFLWTVFFLYRAFGKENKKGNTVLIIIGAVFSVLCVFTKTYMFFIPIVINICSLYDIVKKKHILDTIIYNIVYLCFFIGMYFCVFAINGFERGSNHYTGVFSNLFPISLNTIVYGIIGVVIYTAFFVINTGILPMGSILYEWKSGERKWINRFLLVSIAFMIFEIVFMIFLTEEGVGTLPHKFYFRYFQIFVPIIMILFVKHKENERFLSSIGIRVTMVISLCVVGFYFFLMKGNTREGIMDGHIFLFIENLTKYIVPYIDVALMLLLLLLVFLLFIFVDRKKYMQVMNNLIKTAVIGVTLFWVIEAVQLPYYTNVIADGKTIRSDSIKIAQYLNQEEYEYIYYVYGNQDERSSYIRNYYGYIIQPYQVISEEYMNEIIESQEKNQKEAFLFLIDSEVENDKLERVILDTDRLKLCVPVK